jgi:hypothetical protein
LIQGRQWEPIHRSTDKEQDRGKKRAVSLVFFWSVSRFQEKEKRGEMITINDNINDTRENDNTKIITFDDREK